MHLPIRKELFWDLDSTHLDEHKHKVYIIQQVLNLGTLEEFSAIMKFYGEETVREIIKEVGYLDAKTFSFVNNVLAIKKNELKCYTKKRLHQKHWN